MIFHRKIVWLVMAAFVSFSWADAVRVNGFIKASEQAKKEKKDTAVYVYGSDWSPLSVEAKKKVWDRKSMAKALGNDFVMTSADFKEASMGRDEFQKLTESLFRPASIRKAESAAKDKTKVLRDKSVLFYGECPDRADYKLVFRNGAQKSNIIFLKTKAHDSLPHKGPGRSGSGNFHISELILKPQNALEAEPMKIKAAWCGETGDERGLASMFDGNTRSRWDAGGHRRHTDFTIVLVTEKALSPKTDYSLTLSCQSNAKHLPGRIQIGTAYSSKLAYITEKLYKNTREDPNLKPLHRITDNFPTIALFDSEGRHYGSVKGIRLNDSMGTVINQIRSLVKKRKERDKMWTEANNSSGKKKAELIAKGMIHIGCNPMKGGYNSLGRFGFKDCYKPMFEKMKQADSSDSSHYIRFFEFNIRSFFYKVAGLCEDGKHYEAAKIVGPELNHKKNTHFTPEMKQMLLLAQFRTKRKDKVTEECYNILRKIVALNPDSHYGAGANGFLLMNHKGEVTLTYGWGESHLKKGAFTWDIKIDVLKYFDHPGKYRLTISDAGGNGNVKIKSAALMLKGKTVFKDEHLATIQHRNSQNNQYFLTLPKLKNTKDLTLRITGECIQTGMKGRFAVKSLL